jgi:lysyl-tRNA synthetase class 1
MFWADRIAKEIENTRAAAAAARGEPLVIRDEKTLSGRVHVGSMRGVAIHGLIAEVLAEYGVENVYYYELNDFDPFDSIPSYLDTEKFREHLGKPLHRVPSPEPGYANYAEYYAAEFIAVHKKAGFYPEYYRTYGDLYKAGQMDALITTALEHVEEIRRILKEISGSEKDASWLPISVVCEKCGKMMTTRAFDYRAGTVAYACDKSPDECVPCGHTGRVTPFGGRAKLFWKVDWAAKWVARKVEVEGAGKDHSTKGGSRDVANHIAREVFKYAPPFDIPYEFFLVGGRKMSSSKGRGSSAQDIADLFPSEVLRLVLIGKDINQQIDVDPAGDAVPTLYDWYDELAEGVRAGKADDYSRLFALCELPENRAEVTAPWQMRFREVAFIVQMPHLSLEKEAEAAKGSALTEEERRVLTERAHYARFWLSTYAPEEFKYELQEKMPAVELSQEQKNALASLVRFLGEGQKTGEEIHARLHALKTETPIKPADLFSAIYKIFLNRTSGPKAGWLLASLPRDFVLNRLKEASK